MSKKPVFIIDDDEDVREILIYSLESEGYEVKSFEDPLKALHFLSGLPMQHLPGLIIVDYMMPEMDGITFIHTVKNELPAELRSLTIALSTAMGSMEDFTLPDGVIQLFKPMELDELLRVVELHCLK